MNAPAGINGTVRMIRDELLRDVSILALSSRRLVRDAMDRYRCSMHVAMAAVDAAKRANKQ